MAVSGNSRHSSNNHSSTIKTYFNLFNPLGDILAGIVDILQRLRNGFNNLLKGFLKISKILVDKLLTFLEDLLRDLGYSLDGVDNRIKCILVHPLKFFECLKQVK